MRARGRALVLGACVAGFVVAASAGAGPVDPDGRAIDPLDRSEGVTVLLFARTDCPISNRFAPELRRLEQRFVDAGVRWWTVYPDPDETIDTLREHRRAHGLSDRVLRDPEHDLVRRCGATVTPEAAVWLDGKRVYLGRIDDRYVRFGTLRAEPTRRDLARAIEAALAGRAIAEPVTRAVGCYIEDLR